MSSTPSTWSDERLDQALGNLLRFGVLLAAAVVLLGGVLYLVRHGAEPIPDYHDFHGEESKLRSLGDIMAAARAGSGRGLIQLGILLLIGTPIARVVFSVVAFALQRDYTYVVITLIVLGALLYSLFAEAHL